MGQRNLELRSPLGRQQNDPRLKLWMEYLRLSPSYALARSVLRGDTTLEQAVLSVSDIDALLRTARDFGDVWATSKEEHWRHKAFDLFGVQLANPDLKVVHVMQEGEEIDMADLNAHVREYAAHTRREMGNPLTVLVSVPIDMNRQHLIQLFGGMLTYFKENRQDYLEADIPEPRYKLAKSRIPLRNLDQILKVATAKATNPNIKHWELGAELKLNLTSAEVLKKEGVDPKVWSEASVVMNATVSRILKQALLVSENAARGRFPSFEPCPQAPNKIDYAYVGSKLEATRQLDNLL